jgi:DNA-binding NarL/FixJ family response regulator
MRAVRGAKLAFTPENPPASFPRMPDAKILVIDDEPRMRSNLATILRMEGFEAIEAKDGLAGVDAARRHQPDLIVCDISMPGLDGHGVLAQVRGDALLARVPFVFLTARGQKDDLRTGMNLGADDYLVKPVAAEELLAAVRARLKRAGETAPERRADIEPSPAMLIPLGLTPREAEILFWVSQGKSNPEMCILLNVQLTTVKKHLESVFQKLGVENRTAAAAMALEKMRGD